MPYMSDYAISNNGKFIASCGETKYTLAGYNIGIPTKYADRATSMGCTNFATNMPLFYCPEPSDIIEMNNKSPNIKNALINNNYMQYDWTIDKATPPLQDSKMQQPDVTSIMMTPALLHATMITGLLLP